MHKRKIAVFLLLLVLLFAGLSQIPHYYNSIESKNNGFYEISVICRGRNMENYSSVKAGIDQAADDLDAEVNYVTLSSDNNAAQQISMLRREVGSGANAIVILPVDSSKMVQPIQDAARKIPVVVLQPSVQGLSDVKTVTCDEFQLGSALAQKIVNDEKSVRNMDITVVRSGLNDKGNSQLARGISSVLKKADADISYAGFPEDSKDAYNAAKNLLMKQSGNVIVALDSGSLEAVGKAKKDLSKSGISVSAQIYGVGRTDTTVSLMEDKVIRAVGVENEYSIGYLGVKMAIDSIENKHIENVNVNFLVSDGTNMYEPQNEYMLFPFVN